MPITCPATFPSLRRCRSLVVGSLIGGLLVGALPCGFTAPPETAAQEALPESTDTDTTTSTDIDSVDGGAAPSETTSAESVDPDAAVKVYQEKLSSWKNKLADLRIGIDGYHEKVSSGASDEELAQLRATLTDEIEQVREFAGQLREACNGRLYRSAECRQGN